MIPKFRAWSKVDIKNPEMRVVEGINYHGDGVWFNKIIDDETNVDWAYFVDVILMQSTGLKDKNDVDIFEGDVIGDVNDKSTWGRVVYDGDRCMFRVYGTDFDDALSDYWNEEIIGNIYENPELLKE